MNSAIELKKDKISRKNLKKDLFSGIFGYLRNLYLKVLGNFPLEKTSLEFRLFTQLHPRPSIVSERLEEHQQPTSYFGTAGKCGNHFRAAGSDTR